MLRAWLRPMKRAWISAALTVLSWASAAAEPPTLRLMTYNIRLDIAADGANAWPHRREWVAAQVRWLRPDVFGMQEVRPNQKADLAADLSGYRLFGEGRDAGGEGEASPVGYDSARFELLEGGQFWLSPTPQVSSKGWDAAHPRIVTWVRLKPRDLEQTLLVANTHWDHLGVTARRESAAQMRRWIAAKAQRCERIVVLGDFNAPLESEPMRALIQGDQLREARGASRSTPFGPRGTFNNFRVAPAGTAAIDHVLVGPGVHVERYAVFSQVIDGRVPSDHFPVIVDLRFDPCR